VDITIYERKSIPGEVACGVRYHGNLDAGGQAWARVVRKNRVRFDYTPGEDRECYCPDSTRIEADVTFRALANPGRETSEKSRFEGEWKLPTVRDCTYLGKSLDESHNTSDAEFDYVILGTASLNVARKLAGLPPLKD
jgi:hypothetical protein